MALDYTVSQNQLTLLLQGSYLHFDNQSDKSRLLNAVKKDNIKQLAIKAENLDEWDSSLVVVLFELIKSAHQYDIAVHMDNLPEGLTRLIELAFSVDRKPEQHRTRRLPFLERWGTFGLMIWESLNKGVAFIQQTLIAVGRFFSGRAIMRKIDFWFALDDCGPKAIAIVSLISFMVGLILAFVGAIQLKSFGAQIYVASLVSIGMTRIMGAIMVGIIMAGRTGASYAATIGTMQVNEELDALKTMGIPWSDFLVLPRIMALVLAMPLLTMLADFMGMVGGAAVGVFMLDISVQEYWKYSAEAFGLTNFLVGIFHGLVFGVVIALCGCYYGVHAGRDANSVGVATTKAVVSAIVWMIVMTGIITWFCEVLGI